MWLDMYFDMTAGQRAADAVLGKHSDLKLKDGAISERAESNRRPRTKTGHDTQSCACPVCVGEVMPCRVRARSFLEETGAPFTQTLKPG